MSVIGQFINHLCCSCCFVLFKSTDCYGLSLRTLKKSLIENESFVLPLQSDASPAPRLYKWFGWKITGSAHDVTWSRALHLRDLSWYLGYKLTSIVTSNTHIGSTTFVSGWYVRSGKVGRSCRPTDAIKQESGLAIGQVCLEAAIVRANSDTKGR